MSTVQLRVVGAGLCFLFVFLSGMWLSRSGKPFNSIVLTIHKLVSLAAAVFLVVTVYQIDQVATPSGTEVIAGVVTGLLFLGTGKPVPAAILRKHQSAGSDRALHRREPVPTAMLHVRVPAA